MTRTAATTAGTRAETLARLEHEAGVLIRRARRVVNERARAVHPDLQGASYLILAWLAGEGAMRASAMVDLFGIDKGAISRQLQHLEELGLIVRAPDPDDGRATLVSASEEAIRRLAEVSRKRRAFLDDRLSDWTQDDLESFVELLARYNRTLG